jgi:hypothetical protein
MQSASDLSYDYSPFILLRGGPYQLARPLEGIGQRAGLEALTGDGPFTPSISRNRRSVLRLNKALPPIFPRAVLAQGSFARPFVPHTPPACNRVTGAPIQFVPIASLTKHPAAGLGDSGTPERLAFRSPSARHPPYREATHALGPGFCCVCGQPVYRFGGTLTFGATVPTRMRSGTVLVLAILECAK